ncbi:unnamed protein product [Amoebophrya sp. A120]|nr:unnamed protein product [Amoebophrya sp. A120]|eukprot:GSA120T00017702001.1
MTGVASVAKENTFTVEEMQHFRDTHGPLSFINYDAWRFENGHAEDEEGVDATGSTSTLSSFDSAGDVGLAASWAGAEPADHQSAEIWPDYDSAQDKDNHEAANRSGRNVVVAETKSFYMPSSARAVMKLKKETKLAPEALASISSLVEQATHPLLLKTVVKSNCKNDPVAELQRQTAAPEVDQRKSSGIMPGAHEHVASTQQGITNTARRPPPYNADFDGGWCTVDLNEWQGTCLLKISKWAIQGVPGWGQLNEMPAYLGRERNGIQRSSSSSSQQAVVAGTTNKHQNVAVSTASPNTGEEQSRDEEEQKRSASSETAMRGSKHEDEQDQDEEISKNNYRSFFALRAFYWRTLKSFVGHPSSPGHFGLRFPELPANITAREAISALATAFLELEPAERLRLHAKLAKTEKQNNDFAVEHYGFFELDAIARYFPPKNAGNTSTSEVDLEVDHHRPGERESADQERRAGSSKKQDRKTTEQEKVENLQAATRARLLEIFPDAVEICVSEEREHEFRKELKEKRFAAITRGPGAKMFNVGDAVTVCGLPRNHPRIAFLDFAQGQLRGKKVLAKRGKILWLIWFSPTDMWWVDQRYLRKVFATTEWPNSDVCETKTSGTDQVASTVRNSDVAYVKNNLDDAVLFTASATGNRTAPGEGDLHENQKSPKQIASDVLFRQRSSRARAAEGTNRGEVQSQRGARYSRKNSTSTTASGTNRSASDRKWSTSTSASASSSFTELGRRGGGVLSFEVTHDAGDADGDVPT